MLSTEISLSLCLFHSFWWCISYWLLMHAWIINLPRFAQTLHPPNFFFSSYTSVFTISFLSAMFPHHSLQMLQLFLAEVHHDFKWGPSVSPSHPVAFALAVPSGGVSEGVGAGLRNPVSYWDQRWLTGGSQPCHRQSVRTTGTNLQCQLHTHSRHRLLQLKTLHRE